MVTPATMATVTAAAGVGPLLAGRGWANDAVMVAPVSMPLLV
jgi:hypothetical protein